MSNPSPHLETLLTQWSAGIQAIRADALFQKELLEPSELAAHGNRLTTRERRRSDLHVLEQNFLDSRARWNERLQRIEEWKNAVDQLQQEEARLQSLLGAGVWLEKARRYQDSFTRRLNRGAVRLEAACQIIHRHIESWHTLMQDREVELQNLLNKTQLSDLPFFVSRARKQPEIEFINDQLAMDLALGQELHGMRRLLNHLRARLRRALDTIQHRTSGAEIFYEIHKQELIAALKHLEGVFDQRRAEIMSEALEYESGRHLLHQLQKKIQTIRCIEDIPQPKRGFFR